tara:strand:+ start:495 stop:623 length:129 start_codon:yes stop_codon:yes gene_type:complete
MKKISLMEAHSALPVWWPAQIDHNIVQEVAEACLQIQEKMET